MISKYVRCIISWSKINTVLNKLWRLIYKGLKLQFLPMQLLESHRRPQEEQLKMVSCTFLIITLIFGMCWQSHAQLTADSDYAAVQFCGRRLISEVSKICHNTYYRNNRGAMNEILDSEDPFVLDLRSAIKTSFSRRNITNECCKNPCTRRHIQQYYCGRRTSRSV